MKKIWGLILCIALSLSVLVGCSDGEIGDYIENYEENKQKEEKLTLNMYIIVDDATTENAKTTVKQMINQHTTSTYNTSVVVNYVSAADYQATIDAAMEKTGVNAPHIILITSAEMVDALSSKLVDLMPYLKQKTYQKLNTQIAPTLLEAGRQNAKLYALPNSHVIGGNTGYEYLAIDLEVAEKELYYSKSLLSSYKSLDDAAELIADITAAGYNASDYVYTVNGPYELKAELEADGMLCNVIKYPVADRETAFSSAFAIVKNEYSQFDDRAMRILNAINSDTELRNLLQYGVRGTNYTLDADGNVQRISSGNNVYYMDLKHTGDVFKALFCPELGWTKAAHDNGVKQNSDSVVNK